MKFREFLNESNLSDAIKAYTAIGGNQEYNFPYSDSKMFDILSKNMKSGKKIIAYRGIGVSLSEIEEFYEYDWIPGNIIREDGLKSFTKDRRRAAGFGSGEHKVIFEIELKKYLDMTKESIYNEEEYLTNNLKWKFVSINIVRAIYYIKGTQK